MPGLPNTASGVAVTAVPRPGPSSIIDFGAVLSNVDCENLSDADFAVIREALYKNHVICIKGQKNISARAQAEITRRFDPEAKSYGHDKVAIGKNKKNILHADSKTIPHQPEVQIIGNGFVPEYEGLKDLKLKHPHHKTFHKTAVSEADDHDFTRFYRWHIDAAFYDLNPPLVTSLLAIQVPSGRRQTLRYDDGTNQTLDVPLGTTAFVSGYKMFDLLSPEMKKLALTSKVEYAPHPYMWMSGAKSKSDGLGLHSEGTELPYDQLPPIDKAKIAILPMCWRNPVTGEYALQMHPSAVRKIHLADGTVIDDLKEVREVVHSMQRPGIAPELVYPHDWEEGDLVLFNNQGVLHSVVGAFGEDEVRLFRQCNLAATRPPIGPGPEAVAALEAMAA